MAGRGHLDPPRRPRRLIIEQGNIAAVVDVDEASTWVRKFVPIAEPLTCFQVEPWASVFSAPTDRTVIWFKACAPRHAFEVPLTAGLSARSTLVTEVLASDADRRWLLMADAGVAFRALGNPPARWLEVLPRYAELQIAEAERADQHVGRGVPDLRLDRLPGLFEELLEAQLPLSSAEHVRLVSFRHTFTMLCEELGARGIPQSIQHDDLHMNNVYERDGAIRVLDWGDASIGHPFFSLFETFRFLAESNHLRPGDEWFTLLRDAYLEPWGFG